MDWKALFLKKSTTDFIGDKETMFYDFGEGGFFSLEPRENALVVLTLSGKPAVLFPAIIAIGKAMGYTKVQFQTQRNPKTWERRHGCKQVGYVMEKEL
jgi:hypothetical protein